MESPPKRSLKMAAVASAVALCAVTLLYAAPPAEVGASPCGKHSTCRRAKVAPAHWRTGGRIQVPVTLHVDGHRTKIASITVSGWWRMELWKGRKSNLLSVKGVTHVKYSPIRRSGRRPYRLQVSASFVVDWRASTYREWQGGATSYGTSRVGYHWLASVTQNGSQVESIGQLVRNSKRARFEINDATGKRSRLIRIVRGTIPEDAWMKIDYIVMLRGGGAVVGGIWGSGDYNWRGRMRRSGGTLTPVSRREPLTCLRRA